MKNDTLTLEGKIILSKPIKKMDWLVYEIMSFAEILPPQEQKKIYKYVMHRAIECGYLQNKLKFKHNSELIISD